MAIVINGSGTVTGISVGGLPDGVVDSGTLATDSVIAAKLEASAIAVGDLPAGSVLQVLRAEITNGPAVSTTTDTDLGLSITITPSSTSSKILAFWSIHCRYGVDGSTGYGTSLVRGSTTVWDCAQDYFIFHHDNATDNRTFFSYNYLDSPSADSATTYKIQVRSKDSNYNEFSDNGNQSNMILMEIAG